MTDTDTNTSCNKDNNLVIGIDQSLTETGITYLISPNYYSTHSIKGKGKTSLEKINYIRNKVYESTKEAKIKMPDKKFYAFLEGGSYGSKGMLFTLGQLSGAVIGALDFLNINVWEIPPTTLKQFMSGIGSASKDYMMKKIKEKYNQGFKNDNLADSYSLAVLGYRMLEGKSIFREECNVMVKLMKKIKINGEINKELNKELNEELIG